MSYAGRCSSNDIEKANMLNQYFHSVFSSPKDYCFKVVNPQHSTISNFSICKTTIFEILATLDMTKTRGPDGLPPLFFRKTATEMCKTLNTMFKAVKRNRKIPKAWKKAVVLPIYKQGEYKLVENYRPCRCLTLKQDNREMHLRRTVRALHQVSFLETTRVCTTEISVHEHAGMLDLTQKIHLKERMKKANQVFSSLKRSVAFKVNMRIKLGFYKSMILPVLIYGSSCCNLNPGDMRNLEWFQ